MQNMLLVATGAGQLKTITTIAASQPMVVFGTMNRTSLIRFSAYWAEASEERQTLVCFYETG